jgi:hypothetical protein
VTELVLATVIPTARRKRPVGIGTPTGKEWPNVRRVKQLIVLSEKQNKQLIVLSKEHRKLSVRQMILNDAWTNLNESSSMTT